MTIDKAKLIELLIERTGLEGEQVEDQLSQLIRRIQQAAAEGKSFQIEGFGTFSVKDTTLHFEPADVLETEINQKYAGMKPLELMGAFKERPFTEEETGMDEQEQEDEDIFGIEEIAEPPDAHTKQIEDEEDQEEYAQKSKTSFVFDTEAEGGNPDFGEVESILNPPSQKAKKKEKDPIGTVLVASVIAIAIGVAGWAVYDLDLLNVFGGNGQTANKNLQITRLSANRPQETGNQIGQSLSGTVSGPQNTGAPEQNTVTSGSSKNEDIETQSGSSVYGLRGMVHPEANNGYTIVVHSLESRSKAQVIQGNLGSAGYRVVLVRAVVRGDIYWRVGLGQFETIPEAQRAADTLPESFRTDHFIKRIQQ